MNVSEPCPKRCLCGLSWSRETWRQLVLIGHMHAAEDGELELRNCTCGSTLSVKLAWTEPHAG